MVSFKSEENTTTDGLAPYTIDWHVSLQGKSRVKAKGPTGRLGANLGLLVANLDRPKPCIVAPMAHKGIKA